MALLYIHLNYKSIKFNVRSPFVRPIEPTNHRVGQDNLQCLKLKEILGIWKEGKPPSTEEISCSVFSVNT